MQTLMLCFVDAQVSLKRQLFAMWSVAGLDDARALLNMIHSNNLQHVSLQETRLNDSGQRRFQTLAAEYGYDTFFTRPENDAAGLITDGLVTLTRFDAQIVNIPGSMVRSVCVLTFTFPAHGQLQRRMICYPSLCVTQIRKALKC